MPAISSAAAEASAQLLIPWHPAQAGRVQVDERQALHRRVLGRGDHGEPIDSDLQLDESDAGLFTGRHLLGADRMGRAGDIRLAAQNRANRHRFRGRRP